MKTNFNFPGSVLAVFLALIATAAARGGEPVMTPANAMVEISFTGAADHKDPFNEVTLDVIFTDPAGVERRVPAFWDGGKLWKVRYASPLAGLHTFRSDCSDAADKGLHAIEGSVKVEPYKGDNPLLVHGPLHVTKGSRYLEHFDGTPFFWLGDTWWMGLSKRLVWPEEFKTLLADRKRKGFTVVQIVAGLYPDMPAFDERGANEAGFPWEKEYARIRPEYFDAADRRIFALVDQGIAPCIVGSWGFHMPWLGQAKMRQHQRYLYARWGALPIIWCIAGELNLPFYLSPEFPNHGQALTAEWEKTIAYARTINVFGRPITSHPTGVGRLSMRDLLKDPSLLDFDMLQTPHGQMEVIKPSVEAVRFSYGCKPVMPAVNAEPSYEMLMDRTPAEVTRRVFWVCWASGVKGYTYGANGIWQLNRRDKPYGNSPWGGGYGKISWDEAMNLPGSTQAALGKKLMMEYPWQRFEPHPSWAGWADDAAVVAAPARAGDWIWFAEGEPAQDAPVGACAFRRTFDVPADAHVKQASIAFAADDRCTVWLNGEEIGAQSDWHALRRIGNLGARLKSGRNVLAIRGENVASNVTKNPAGLTFGLKVELEGGKTIEVLSDAHCKASREEPAGWHNGDFDDAKWPAAKVAAAAGGGPWGQISDEPKADAYTVPYAFGIAGEVRFVYVPTPRPITIAELEANVSYTATYFDPVKGDKTKLGEIHADTSGHARIDAPTTGHDWVLVLDHAK